MQFGVSIPVIVTPSFLLICNQGRLQQATLSLQCHGLPQMPELDLRLNVGGRYHQKVSIWLKKQSSEPVSNKHSMDLLQTCIVLVRKNSRCSQ
jgi:hypothetical protein